MQNKNKITAADAVELRRLICVYVSTVEKWQPLIYTIQKSCIYSAEYKSIIQDAEHKIYNACLPLYNYIDSLTDYEQ